jgi:serine/threonine protein kinase
MKIAHYEVLEEIGAGGMGVVYRAFDSKLEREVALKVLRPESANDRNAIERFQREAKVAAKLIHPAICRVHSQLEVDGQLVIDMEFVPGTPLSRYQRPNLERGLDLAVQMTDALKFAHKHDVLHRDLTPRNVIVTPDRHIKLLDFGLAKRNARVDKLQDITATIDNSLTGTDELLGTPGYIAPEVVKGQSADARSDQFSVGVVVYELITGRRAFPGRDRRSALLATITDHPQWPKKIERKSPDLVNAVNRAMSKNPADRFSNVAQLHRALERIKQNPSRQSNRGVGWRGGVAIAASLMTICIAAVSWRGKLKPIPPTPQLSAQPSTGQSVLERRGQITSLNLSREGGSAVFASQVEGRSHILRQVAGVSRPVDLTPGLDCDNTQPSLSPDNALIVFRSECHGGGLFSMDSGGGNLQQLATEGYDPAWSPNGLEIAYTTGTLEWKESVHMPSRSELRVLRLGTNGARHIRAGNAFQPAWSSDGTRIAYSDKEKGQQHIWMVAANGSEAAIRLTNDRTFDFQPRWSGNDLYFLSSRPGRTTAIWHVEISAETGDVRSRPRLFLEKDQNLTSFVISHTGKLAYVEQVGTSSIEKRTISMGTTPVVHDDGVNLAKSIDGLRSPDVSPSGSGVAVSTITPYENILVLGVNLESANPITYETHRIRAPRYSFDGKKIAFYSDLDGTLQVYIIDTTGGKPERVTSIPNTDVLYPVWAPDGFRIVYSPANRNAEIIDLRLPRGRQVVHMLSPLPGEPNCVFVPWSWSTDGQRLAGFSQCANGSSVGIRIYELNQHRYQKITTFGSIPRFVKDGQIVVFADRGILYWAFSSPSAEPHQLLSLIPDLIAGGFSIASDDSAIYFSHFSPQAILFLPSS